jgi:abortive infection bacteriophage resistance protein
MENNIQYDKPFKTHDELIAIMESRNIVVQDHDFARRILNSISYYTLINGYKDTFLSVPGTNDFMPGTNFYDLYTLHLIDTNLNNIILKYILFIEKYLKTRISYVVSKNYGVYTDPLDMTNNNPDDYLCRNNYSRSANAKARNNVLFSLKEKLSAKNSNDSIRHYMTTKNHIPSWILVTSITFGSAIKWYSIMKSADKEEVCNYFIPSTVLTIEEKKEFVIDSFSLLREYRNKIAHSSRTFNTSNLPVLPKKQLLLLSSGILSEEEYNRGSGKSDLYGVIIDCIILLDDKYLMSNFLLDLIYTLRDYQDREMNGKPIFEILGIPVDIFEKLKFLIESKNTLN